MECHERSLTYSEDDATIHARFEGTMDGSSISLFLSLSHYVRGRQGKRVLLDISDAASIHDTGLPGLIALEDAASASGGGLQIQARGPHAAEKLAEAGLARMLYSGP